MNRREFLEASLMAGAAASMTLGAAAESPNGDAAGQREFKLKYAPHFGMFKHHAGDDPISQLDFMADQGFKAMEDNGMMGRPVELQEKIASAMRRLNMTMGVFVAYAEWREPKMVHRDADVRAMLVQQMKNAVEVAKRVNAKWCTVVPGPYDGRLDWDYQTANLVENLKACADVCEPAGLIMVLEPLNPRNHPGLFLTKISQAYQICRAVGSPSCKILDDLYHQQGHRGQPDPQHRSGLGRDCLLPGSVTIPVATSPPLARSTTATCSATSTTRASTGSSAWSTATPPPESPANKP